MPYSWERRLGSRRPGDQVCHDRCMASSFTGVGDATLHGLDITAYTAHAFGFLSLERGSEPAEAILPNHVLPVYQAQGTLPVVIPLLIDHGCEFTVTVTHPLDNFLDVNSLGPRQTPDSGPRIKGAVKQVMCTIVQDSFSAAVIGAHISETCDDLRLCLENCFIDNNDERPY